MERPSVADPGPLPVQTGIGRGLCHGGAAGRASGLHEKMGHCGRRRMHPHPDQSRGTPDGAGKSAGWGILCRAGAERDAPAPKQRLWGRVSSGDAAGNDEAAELLFHYGLEKTKIWRFWRNSYPWATKSRRSCPKRFRTLEVQMEAELEQYRSECFRTPVVGDR